MAEGIFQPIRARARGRREVSAIKEGAALLAIVERVPDSEALLQLVKEVME